MEEGEGMSTRIETGEHDRRMREAGEWLLRLHDKSLPDSQVSEWIKWCETDPGNLVAFERMQTLWLNLGASTPPILNARKRWFDWRGMLGPRRRILAALAATVVTVVAVVGLWTESPSLLDHAARQASSALSTTLLPDGSSLVLGARTLVSVKYGKDRRLEMREGEAFFQVAHDKERPFVVEAGPIEVLAVGTAFDIRRNEGRVSVAVADGRVEVSVLPDAHDSTPARKLILDAGQEFKWDAGSARTYVAKIDRGAAASWRSGRLEYVKEPLGVVMADVNRYASRRIEIADAAIADLEFTGTVSTGSVDDWLDALPQAFPLVLETQSDRVVIRPRP